MIDAIHGNANSIERRLGDPLDPASVDLIVIDWADGFHEERPQPIEPQERTRRQRLARLKAFRVRASLPPPTVLELKAAIDDIIDEMGVGG